MGSRRFAVLAWSLFGVAVVFKIIQQVLIWTSPPLASSWSREWWLLLGIASLAFPAVGAVIASRRPDHRIGWLMVGFGVVDAAHVATMQYRDLAIIKEPGLWVGGEAAAWLVGPLLVAKMAAVTFLVLLYPDGRPASQGWRVLLWLLGGYVAVDLLAFGFAPGPLIDFPQLDNPMGISGVLGNLLGGYVALGCPDWLWPLALLLGVVSLIQRYRRSGWRERQQIKWFTVGVAIVAVAVALVVAALGDSPQDPARPELLPIAAAVLLVAGIALPASIGYALLRHHLLDINLAVSRSLVYAMLTFGIGAAYFGTAAGLGITAGSGSGVTVAVLVTVVAILAFQPLRRRLDRAAARLVYGHRLTGYELLTQLGEALEHAFDPKELATKVATAVRDGLALRWSRVTLEFTSDGHVVRETSGAAGIAADEPVPAERVVVLRHGGEPLGAIECGPKLEGRFVAADEQLLENLARQAALAFHNGRLAAELAARLDEIRRQAEELAASRTRIIHAQDVERRRLEQNLHDGVQQEIVALITKLRLARNQLRRDPALADATLVELQEEARQILESIRELARGIHPAILTDQGLTAAVEAQAGRLPVAVVVEATPETRELRLPDDVEAAAYFVVTEALANALKHAGARRMRVRLDYQDRLLVVEVADDGAGFVPADTDGTGLTGMRDRIEALHGRLRVVSSPGTGARVIAELPAAALAADAAPRQGLAPPASA